MKRTHYRFSAIILVLFLLFGVPIVASAEVPYESYNYWENVSSDRKEVYSRAMYEPGLSISAASIGVADFTKINNVATDSQGNIYILDNASRIVMTDKNYNLIGEIGLINGTESYNEANSIYVHSDSSIYICDTNNHRILHITTTGGLIDTLVLPESPLIPDDFDFRPMYIAIDQNGYIYVISNGSYYGALLYGQNKEFLGFYGANTVSASISSVFNNIMNRVFPNNEKKGNTARKLPYSFIGITTDNEGFVYTCNGYTSTYQNKGQIRRLSPGTGSNILDSNSANFVDTDVNTEYNDGALAKQNIMDIEVDSNGFIYGLESAFGKVFVYDEQCRVLNVFGGGMGAGTQLGSFTTVSGMALLDDGNRILVSDSTTNLITVFKINSFGTKVKKQLALTLNGDYLESEEGWKEILTLDRNFQPAYSALARVELEKENYSKAMEYAKTGYDREVYGVAFEYVRSDFISDNFLWIFIVIIIIVAGLIVFLVVSSKKKLTFIKNKELSMMFSTLTHPVNTFTDIKEKGYGSVLLCFITLILYYVVTILQTLKGGFLFSIYDAESFNSFWVLIRSVGLVVLWIVADWLVCTLLGGKGKLKEIIIVTCYSLWPLIIAKILRLVLTNVLLPTEASFLSILDTIALLYFVFLIIIGLLKIHDFSMSRLVGTSALAIVGIAAIIFLIIMVVILLQKLGGFVITVISELQTF